MGNKLFKGRKHGSRGSHGSHGSPRSSEEPTSSSPRHASAVAQAAAPYAQTSTQEPYQQTVEPTSDSHHEGTPSSNSPRSANTPPAATTLSPSNQDLISVENYELLKPLLEATSYTGTGSLANPRLNESGAQLARVVFVGESDSGKTSLIERYTKRKFTHDIKAPVHDQFTKMINLLDTSNPLELILIDTPGSETESSLRELNQAGADVYVVCFSLSDPIALQNLQTKWLPQLIQESDLISQNIPFLLVGCKNDVRYVNPNFSSELMVQFSHQVRAFKYLECSAKVDEGCDEVIHEAIAAVTEHEFEDI